MKKKTFAIYTVLMLVFVIAAGFIGYDLGKAKGSIFAKNTNVKNLTKITSNGASSKKNDKDSKTTDASSIAIVNLDEGVKVKDKTIYYSQKVSEFPTSDFYFTSLSEAEKGVSEGSIGAYVIIPAKFSSNVITLNQKPVASELDYKISKKLNSKKQLRALYNIVNFGNSVNNNLSYMYLENTLSEFHDAQDAAKTVIDNDSKDLEAINNISSTDLITVVEIPELKQVEETPQSLDISKCTTENDNTLKEINDGYQKIIADAQNKLQSIQSQKKVLETTLDELSKEVEKGQTSQDTNPTNPTLPYEPTSDNRNSKDILDKILLEQLQKSDAQRNDLQEKVNKLTQQVADLEKIINEQSVNGNLSASSVPSLVSSQSDTSNAATYKQTVAVTYNKNELTKGTNNIPVFNIDVSQDAKKKQNVAVTQAMMEKLIGYLGPEKLNEFATFCDGDASFKQSLALTDYKTTNDFIQSIRKQGTDMLWSNATIGYSGSTLNDLSNFAREQATVEETKPEDKKQEHKINPVLKNKLEDLKNTTSQIKEVSDKYYVFDKDALENQIMQEVVNPLIGKTQKEANDYKAIAQKQQEAIKQFSDTISKTELLPETEFDKTATTKLTTTQNDLLNLLNESNQSYGDYVNKIYETSMNNQQTIFESLSKASDDSKKQIESGLAETKRIKNQDSQDNQHLMNDFIAKLPYTRLGSIENENVYQYMANPVTLKGNIHKLSGAKTVLSGNGMEEKATNNKANKALPQPPKVAWYLLIILIVLLAIGIMTMAVINRSQQENEDWE